MSIGQKVNKIPKKSLGQNFLIDKNISNKIINEIDIRKKNVIEIGPGYGILTDYIIKKKPLKLILIEKDNEIFNFLKQKYSKLRNINIYNLDALKFNFAEYKNICVISNTPYNISSALINKIMQNSNYISIALLMLQKEVAEKYDYKKRKANKYKFFAKLCSEYEICFNISRNVFYPKPKIKSCIVKFKFFKNKINWEKVETFSKIIFSNRRKKISNKINLDTYDKSIMDKRIEDLKIEEIIKIYKCL